MTRIYLVTEKQKAAIEAGILEEKNLFLGNAVTALKNGVSVKAITSQVEERGFKIFVNNNDKTLRVFSGSPKAHEKEILFHELHSPRFYFVYLLSHGYNVSFNDWED